MYVNKPTFISYFRESNFLWHGSYANGTHAQELSCGNWMIDQYQQYGLASDILHEEGFLHQHKAACNSLYIVLCIEIRPFHPAPISGIGTRHRNGPVFLSFEQHVSIIDDYDNLR